MSVFEEKEEKEVALEAAAPSLQLSCLNGLLRCETPQDLISALLSLKQLHLPSSLVEYLFHQMMKSGRMTKETFNILVAMDIEMMDFTGMNFSNCEEGLFDSMFEGERCVEKLILNGVDLEPCFFQMFATTARLLPPPSTPRHLIHLHVNNCESLNDTIITFFADSFPLLESLLISNCSWLTAESIIAIANSSFCQTLKVLDVSYNAVSEESMSYLTNLIALEKLNISHTQSDNSFQFILTSPKFEVMHMSSLPYLNDDGIKCILSGGALPNNNILKVLKELHLTESSISSSCLSELISLSCPTEGETLPLRKLDLSWSNENLNSSAIYSLVSRCCHLIDLRMQSTDAGEAVFAVITSQCKQLQVFHFSRCIPELLSIRSLSSLEHLKELNLAWAMFASEELDAWIDSLSAFTSKIEKLSLQGCHGVSESFIYRLDENTDMLESLHTLDLSWVNAMSTSMAKSLSLRRPHMEVTDYYCQVFKGGVVISNDLTED